MKFNINDKKLLNFKSGIYKISNIINKKIYIGSGVSLRKRYREHKHALMKKCHKNPKLQMFVNKYGIGSLIFSLVEIVKNKKNLVKKENFWIKKTNCVESGFNIYTDATSPLGTKRNEISKKKMSRITKAYWKSLSEKERQAKRDYLSSLRKGKCDNLKQLIEINKNRIYDPPSDKTKLKMALKKIKSLTPKQYLQICKMLKMGMNSIKISKILKIDVRLVRSNYIYRKLYKNKNDRPHNAILSSRQVREIIKKLNLGKKPIKISKDMNIDRERIYCLAYYRINFRKKNKTNKK